MRQHIGWAVGLTAWRIDWDGEVFVKTWVYTNGADENSEDQVIMAARAAFKERLDDLDWRINHSIMRIKSKTEVNK